MYTKIAKQIIKNLAEKKGVSEATVIEEMNACICAAMENPDPLVQMRWQQMFGTGKKPTPIEFLSHMFANPVEDILNSII